MVATATKLRGPDVVGGYFEATYQVLLDTSIAAGGEAIDLTGDFSQIDEAYCSAVEVVGDAAYQYTCIVPDVGVALTSSNFLICVHQVATGDAVAFDEANTVDLSAVGELRLVVKGKKSIPTSWV